MIIKNRNRKKPTFANINLLGKCNADCYFCLGKDIENELFGINQLEIPYTKWKNFNKFLRLCVKNNIDKLYFTGQTADGLQYKYIDYIVNHLQTNWGFNIGVRTNGILAPKKMKCINEMKGGYWIFYSFIKPKYKL